MKNHSDKILNKKTKREGNQAKNKKEYRNIVLLNIKNDYSGILHRNKFIIFKSINDIYSLVCVGSNLNSIIFYNLIDNKIMNIIHNPHPMYTYSLRYFFYKSKKMDLIMSIAHREVKIWNLNLECIFLIENIYPMISCFLQNNKEIYIVALSEIFSSPPFCDTHNEQINIYDLKGKKIKTLNYFLENCEIVENYYDKNIQKNFIIFSVEDGLITSFDFNKNKIYHKYNKGKFSNSCYDLDIINLKDKVNLIELGKDKTIRLWDFHSGEFLKKIELNADGFKICIWDTECVFIGYGNGEIKLVNLNEGKIIKEIKNEDNKGIGNIEKINIPKYGDCLVSQDFEELFCPLRIWIFENQAKEK